MELKFYLVNSTEYSRIEFQVHYLYDIKRKQNKHAFTFCYFDANPDKSDFQRLLCMKYSLSNLTFSSGFFAWLTSKVDRPAYRKKCKLGFLWQKVQKEPGDSCRGHHGPLRNWVFQQKRISLWLKNREKKNVKWGTKFLLRFSNIE